MSNEAFYLEQEFQTLIAAQWGKETLPSPTVLRILRTVFFAGAQSIYIGIHQSTGLPQSDFINQVGDEIGSFVIGVVEKNGN